MSARMDEDASASICQRELQTRPNRQSHAPNLLAWHQPQKQMIQSFHLLDIKGLICLVLYALLHRKPTNRAIQIAHHHIVSDLQYQLCINMPILNKISRLHEVLAVNDQCNLHVSHVQENTLSGDLIKSSCAACMKSSQLLMYTILPEFLESKEKLCAIHVRISDSSSNATFFVSLLSLFPRPLPLFHAPPTMASTTTCTSRMISGNNYNILIKK